MSYVGVESGRPRPKRKPGVMMMCVAPPFVLLFLLPSFFSFSFLGRSLLSLSLSLTSTSALSFALSFSLSPFSPTQLHRSGGALVLFLLVALAWKHGPRAGSTAGGLPGMSSSSSSSSSSKADALPPHALPGGAKPPPDHHDVADESAAKALEEAREAERREREKKGGKPGAAGGGAGAAAAASSSSSSHHPDPATSSAASCSLQEEPWLRDSKTLVPAESNGQPSAEACREACAATPGCNAWTWCFDGNGCPLMRGALAPSLGCELSREPLRPRGATTPGMVTHYGSSCYISGYVRERRPDQETFVRLHSSPAQPRVLVVTEVPSRDQGCAFRGGTEAMLRHVLNKQDYARWHSYEFSLISEPLDDDLHPRGGSVGGQWNKVAALSRMLQETPMRRNSHRHSEENREGAREEEEEEDSWILYQFFDAMIDDVGFTFPFESYAGKDLIVVGDAAKVAAGDPSSLDTGALLLRNSRWARGFVRRLETAIMDSDQPPPEVAATTDLVAKAITDLLAANPETDLPRVRFETDFCVNCDWRRIDLAASGGEREWGRVEWRGVFFFFLFGGEGRTRERGQKREGKKLKNSTLTLLLLFSFFLRLHVQDRRLGRRQQELEALHHALLRLPALQRPRRRRGDSGEMRGGAPGPLRVRLLPLRAQRRGGRRGSFAWVPSGADRRQAPEDPAGARREGARAAPALRFRRLQGQEPAESEKRRPPGRRVAQDTDGRRVPAVVPRGAQVRLLGVVPVAGRVRRRRGLGCRVREIDFFFSLWVCVVSRSHETKKTHFFFSSL